MSGNRGQARREEVETGKGGLGAKGFRGKREPLSLCSLREGRRGWPTRPSARPRACHRGFGKEQNGANLGRSVKEGKRLEGINLQKNRKVNHPEKARCLVVVAGVQYFARGAMQIAAFRQQKAPPKKCVGDDADASAKNSLEMLGGTTGMRLLIRIPRRCRRIIELPYGRKRGRQRKKQEK